MLSQSSRDLSQCDREWTSKAIARKKSQIEQTRIHHFNSESVSEDSLYYYVPEVKLVHTDVQNRTVGIYEVYNSFS